MTSEIKIPIPAELMPRHELDGCKENYERMPIVVQKLLRHEQWLQELIMELKTHEKSFQIRERQRAESERSIA